MAQKDVARKARQLMVKIDRNLKKAQDARDELCALLCGAVEQYGEVNSLSRQDVDGIVAPKDD